MDGATKYVKRTLSPAAIGIDPKVSPAPKNITPRPYSTSETVPPDTKIIPLDWAVKTYPVPDGVIVREAPRPGE